jgi:hypothetical protein
LAEVIKKGKCALPDLEARAHGRACDGKKGTRSPPDPNPQSQTPFARFSWQSISPHDGHAAPAGDFLIVRDQRELVLERGGADEPVGGIFVRPIQID